MVNLAKNFPDSDDETQYLSVRDGGLTIQKKVKQNTVPYDWTDLFRVCTSLYVTKHTEYATALFKYMHKIC